MAQAFHALLFTFAYIHALTSSMNRGRFPAHYLTVTDQVKAGFLLVAAP